MRNMKQRIWAIVLALAMVLSLMVTPVSAVSETETSTEILSALDEDTLSVIADAAETKAAASSDCGTVRSEDEENIKESIYNDIFLNTDSVVDVSGYNTSTTTLEALTEEVLEENNASDLVTVTYEEDELTGNATVMCVDMDTELATAISEVNTSNVYTVLTAEQTQTLLYMYSVYLTFYNENVAYLGRQTAWFTSYEQDDEGDGIGPLGSLLVLAGVSLDDVRTGDYSYDEVMGTLMTFYYAYYFGVQFYGEDILAAKDDAMDAVDNSAYRTDAQKLLVLTDWMSNQISFDMGYIINLSSDDEDIMACADPQENEYYDVMYQTFYNMYYEELVGSYGEEYGAYYADVAAQQMVEGVETMWESCVIGALGLGKAVCLGYATTFAYLMQWAYPEVYAADGRTLTTDSSSWKTVEELNYITTSTTETVTTTETTWDGVTYYAVSQGSSEGEESGEDETEGGLLLAETTTEVTDYPLYVWNEDSGTYVQATDEDGNSLYVVYTEETETTTENTGYPVYITGPVSKDVTTYTSTFDIDSGYIVDIVRIDYDASVTMYGEANEDFNSQHFWNAVKIDDQWYYIDTNYIDIYTEALIRDRVETNGDMNHNYFLFSDTTARSLYSGNYDDILTLYEDVATDTSYEGNTWMYFAGSNVYADGKGKFYYVYDSTDMMGMATSTDTMTMLLSLMSSMFGSSDDEDDTEYKIVYHTFSSSDLNTATDFTTLIDFNEGTVYDPSTKKLVENELIQELYALHQEYEQLYPSLSLTMALYDDMIYFNLANCVLSYDLSTGDVVKVKEYNEVGAVRDTSEVFAGTAFDVVYDLDEADVVVNNPPIAGLTIYDDTLYVDVATNYAWISGKTSMMDTSSYGWEYAQTNYNPDYSTYLSDYLSGAISMLGISESMMQYLMQLLMSEMGIDYEEEVNDNDEFMWTANFTDSLSMSVVTSDDLEYETVSVAATCGRDAFTEERSEEGLINDGTREVEEGTACEHHYVKYDETYYTTDDDGNYNTGTCYVCTICGYCVNEDDNDEDSDSDEWDLAVASAGHTYVATDDGIEWASDYSYATVTGLVCDVCGDMTNEVIRVVDGEQETITVASLDCLVDDDTVSLTFEDEDALICDVMSEVSGSCDSGLTIVYSAIGPEGSVCEGQVLAAVTVETEAGSHAYVASDDDWIWTENNEGGYDAVLSVATCSVCGATVTNLDAVVTSETVEPTCEEAGNITYTAVATIYDENNEVVCTLTGTKVVTLEALGHTYSEPVFTWSEDYSFATAAFTCEVCNNVETVTTTVTFETTDAICTEGGQIVYTATVEFEGVTYTDTKTVVLEALGHTYGEPVFTWNEDCSAAMVVFTCAICGDVETVTATITSETTAATCTEAGQIVYTATAEFEGTTYTDIKIVEIAATGHTYGEAVFTWSEDYSSATAAFTCEVCGSVETVTAAVTSETTAATCTEDGQIVYTATVELGGVTYTDTKTVELEAIGHTYGEAVFTWSEDYSSATVTVTCSVCGATMTETATVISAASYVDAQIVYTATVEIDGVTYTNAKVVTITNPFTDVHENDYFYAPVLWAIDNGITTGTTDTTFSPYVEAERCQVVTFLWRAAGCPEVSEDVENPFTDVKERDYFYTAVLWAVENGITTGTSATTFSPYAVCERCQVVTFLYRYFGEPEVTTTTNPFTDVNADHYFYNAVLWAVENGITTGTTETTFGPFVTCERCMIVTFLYRAILM